MVMHPAEGKGFFHGLHLLNAGYNVSCAFFMQVTKVSASFKHGITTDNSSDPVPLSDS
jgi:hypothetical protein